jgi:hypothetical protein
VTAVSPEIQRAAVAAAAEPAAAEKMHLIDWQVVTAATGCLLISVALGNIMVAVAVAQGIILEDPVD